MSNELNTCVFCGSKFTGYGNSTAGYWQVNGSSEQEDQEMSEKYRCCDNCNMTKVIPARMILLMRAKKNG